MRQWQEPLTEDKILWLQQQFALHKARIEAVWGVHRTPWTENRR